jgi:hypothetical protein
MRRERPDHTLQTSALVNEAYLRMVDAGKVDWKSRAHFLQRIRISGPKSETG